MRHIRQGSIKSIEREDLNAVVYIYDKNVAMGFSGKRQKDDFFTSFRSEERMMEYIHRFFQGVEATIKHRQNRKEQRRRERDEFIRNLEVGTILYTCWGYEQTNVEFFQVTKIKGSTVWVREIANDTTEETGSMSCNIVARPDAFIAEEKKYVVRGPYVSISESRTASKWDGRSKHSSWYA